MRSLLFAITLLFCFSLFGQQLTPLKKGNKYAFFLNEQRVTNFIYDAVSDPHPAGYVDQLWWGIKQ